MKNEHDAIRQKVLTRRALVLAGGKLAILSVLAGRMYQLQVVNGAKYQTLADDNRINLRLIAPRRGRILDRFGQPLATSQMNLRVVVIPEQTDDIDETIATLARLIDLPEYQIRKAKREMARVKAFVPVTLAENLTYEEFAAIGVRSPELPGVQPDMGETRLYPYGTEVAHVIGYVAAVSEQDMKQDDDPVLQVPGFKIGKNGLERTFDAELRGEAGSAQVEVNAYGRMIRELSREEGSPGQDLVLGLDLDLQRFAHERMGEQSGAVVLMDVHTGELLACASTPGFDPNPFNLGLSKTEWNGLRANPRSPLINKPISGAYPPGSTFKMMTALAGLQSGAIQPGHTVFCSGSTQLGNHTFYCWRKAGHGTMTIQSALEQSCDCFYYDVARRTGIDQMAAFIRKFGLGEKTGIELPGEKSGLLPTQAWKQRALKKPWNMGETLIAGIGQGYVLATPLQLATMTARLVNGGLAVAPRLARQTPEALARIEKIDVDPRWLDMVVGGMVRVMNGPQGTARKFRIDDPAMKIGGKTGTAQVVRISKAERLSGHVRHEEDKPWEERHHGLFVGFGPVDRPRYAVSAIVEHGGAAVAAIPIAVDLLRRAMERDPLSKPALGATIARNEPAPGNDKKPG